MCPVRDNSMDVSELFHSPGGGIENFFKAQVQLYRHDRSLHDYFMPLQMSALSRARPSSNGSNPDLRKSLPIRIADHVSRMRDRRKIKADVLVCPNPDSGRRTETRFLIRQLLGIAETGASILCLLPSNTTSRGEIDAALEAAGRRKQVQFLDPANPLNPAESSIRRRMARIRAQSAFADTIQLLETIGLSPDSDALNHYHRTAMHVENWNRLQDTLEFDAVVTRCHWLPLCSCVSRTALERGIPTITFQQGVIGHSLDAPVTASSFVAFGNASISFLSALNATFYDAARIPRQPIEYIPGGCFVDEIDDLSNQFSNHTLLIVDIPTGQSDFYGVENQSQALLQLGRRLLQASSSLRRIIIRPHPYWSDLEFSACQRLAIEYPTRCEISHPAWSLEDDLRRSSAIIGIFSGVVTVASACGIPSIFLQTEDGYSTGDLAPFSPTQTLMPDAAHTQILRLMDDADAYEQARTAALRNAREYYAGGATLQCTGSFFEPLLKPRPAALEQALP